MSEKTKKDTTKPVAAVFGAAGYTGRFVIAKLSRREMTPIAMARNAEALATTDLSCARLANDFPMIVSRRLRNFVDSKPT